MRKLFNSTRYTTTIIAILSSIALYIVLLFIFRPTAMFLCGNFRCTCTPKISNSSAIIAMSFLTTSKANNADKKNKIICVCKLFVIHLQNKKNQTKIFSHNSLILNKSIKNIVNGN